MLLTCPECSAKYTVADGAIPSQGRSVRCAACQHTWRQMPVGGTDDVFNLGEAAKNLLPNNGLRLRPKAAPSGPVEPHARMRKRTHDKMELANRLAAGVPWAIAASILVIGGFSAIGHRTDIVRAWPKSASVFAAVGQPANLYGIDISAVQARSRPDGTGTRVLVGGVLTSVSRHDEPVPYLKVALVTAKGEEKLSWMVDPGIEVLKAGQVHRFQTGRAMPARGGLRAVVVFAEPPRKAPRPSPPPPEPPTGKSGLMGAKAPNASSAPKATDPNSHLEPVTAR
jgi:predicted Zn finger-like uncharacterized protein